jgi:hypothetical protein
MNHNEPIHSKTSIDSVLREKGGKGGERGRNKIAFNYSTPAIYHYITHILLVTMKNI